MVEEMRMKGDGKEEEETKEERMKEKFESENDIGFTNFEVVFTLACKLLSLSNNHRSLSAVIDAYPRIVP